MKIGLWIWWGLALVEEMCACDSWCSCLPLLPFSNLYSWGGLFIVCGIVMEGILFDVWLKISIWEADFLVCLFLLFLTLMRCFHSCSVTTHSLEIHWKTKKSILEKTSLCTADFLKHENLERELINVTCLLELVHVTTKLMHLSEYHKYFMVIVTVF